MFSISSNPRSAVGRSFWSSCRDSLNEYQREQSERRSPEKLDVQEALRLEAELREVREVETPSNVVRLPRANVPHAFRCRSSFSGCKRARRPALAGKEHPTEPGSRCQRPVKLGSGESTKTQIHLEYLRIYVLKMLVQQLVSAILVRLVYPHLAGPVSYYRFQKIAPRVRSSRKISKNLANFTPQKCKF